MITVNTFLGGQFALSVATPRSSAPLRSANSLWGIHCNRGRRLRFFLKQLFRNKITLTFAA
ncbi:MAG: hypothetical protein ACOH1X_10410 [Kaistella sp.]